MQNDNSPFEHSRFVPYSVHYQKTLNNLKFCASITSIVFMLLTQCLHGIDIELQILLDLLFGRMFHFWQFYWLAKYHQHRHLQYRP